MEGLRESLGRLLRGIRRERRLTIVDLEALTEKHGERVPRSRISMLERGEAPLRFEDLQGLARAYGVSLFDLLAEAVAARPGGRFSPELSAEEAFEEGKKLFHAGRLQEAGWAFDLAAELASSRDRELSGLARTSAGHAYDRVGARRLALRRLEQALDILEKGSDGSLRAMGKMSVLLAKSAAPVRAEVFLRAVLAELEAGVGPDLEAYLLGVSSSVFDLLDEQERAVDYALRSSRRYRQLGQIDMAALKLAAASTYEARGGNCRQGLRHARDAQAHLEEMERVDARIFVLLALGEVLFHSQAIEEARTHLEDAFRIASAHQIASRAREASILLEKLAAETGDKVEQRRWKARLKGLSRGSFEEFWGGTSDEGWDMEWGRRP